MLQYEVNFIVDPVLSGDEIKTTAKTYEDMLKDVGCTIVNVDDLGLKQLAYPIKKRTSGIYYVVEFQTPKGDMISKMELALKRDERILRFLTVKLDKYGVKYNQDKRDGKIGSVKKSKDASPAASVQSNERGSAAKGPAQQPTKPRKTLNSPAPAAAPVAEAKKEEEE